MQGPNSHHYSRFWSIYHSSHTLHSLPNTHNSHCHVQGWHYRIFAGDYQEMLKDKVINKESLGKGGVKKRLQPQFWISRDCKWLSSEFLNVWLLLLNWLDSHNSILQAYWEVLCVEHLCQQGTQLRRSEWARPECEEAERSTGLWKCRVDWRGATSSEDHCTQDGSPHTLHLPHEWYVSENAQITCEGCCLQGGYRDLATVQF